MLEIKITKKMLEITVEIKLKVENLHSNLPELKIIGDLLYNIS